MDVSAYPLLHGSRSVSSNDEAPSGEERENGIRYDEYQNQQVKLVKGKVTDATGAPLPGVNVREKGNLSNGVITGIDGF